VQLHNIGSIAVRECPRGDAPYAAYAASSPAPTGYHRPEWLNAVEDAFGLPCFRLLAERDGQALGMLPLCHIKSALFGNFLVSVPFGNCGGIVVSDPAAHQPLLDAAVRLAESRGCRWVELRQIEPLPLSLETHTRKVVQVLPLKPDPEEMWKSLSSERRNRIRKAEKSGLTGEIVGREGLNDFYDVFARNMRDLGTPVYSRRFFEALFDHLADVMRICLVRGSDGTLMAALVLVAYRKTIEAPWVAALREYNSVCANNYLYWIAMKYGCERGFELFDFGTSDRDSGVFQTKKQWGAEAIQLHRQFWLAPGQTMPHLNPSNPKYAAKIRTWQKLPIWLTKLIGPPLAKKLP